ncbi:MAG: polyphosphate kinase 1 [Spirochaetes bacterium]|nr:polyphosphate kinase 1 [Spirochaetota bacterium]
MKDQVRLFNRELSWVEFNARVLEEALDRSNPPLERLKFISIVGSNFDEFFMVRVAAIKAAIRSGEAMPDAAGMTPEALLAAIGHRVRELTAKANECMANDILPELAGAGLVVLRPAAWTPSQMMNLGEFYRNRVVPTLTPLSVGHECGFPSTGNLRIHAAFLLEPDDGIGDPAGRRLAIVQVPHNVERFVPVASDDGTTRVALLDDIVLAFGHSLFPGYSARERILFKVTRDADIGVDEDRDDDFVAAMEEVLVNRQNSWPVCLAVSEGSAELRDMLRDAVGLSEGDVYGMAGQIDLRSFMELSQVKGFDSLRFPPAKPAETGAFSGERSVWDEILKRDILLHVPYESFSPVIRFVEEAAFDPAVLAIKMTLYRTSGDSPVVKALTAAARNGKQVTVVVELKARFDEARNIAWAGRLEQAGAIVVYGLARLKVHAKAILVIRREDDGSILRYAHLSTGNYNDRTARLYADLSLFTVNEAVCYDVGLFFNAITGVSDMREFRTIAVAPFGLKRRIISMIDREAERSTRENPGLIMAKMNALADVDVVEALYRASSRGVRVLLNVRGVCVLVPGVPGLSENVTVVSVVGRVLEHARAFHFRNGGAGETYLSSADWMPRNLDRRIELLFPVFDERARARVRDVLESYFRDTRKARVLMPSGEWRKAKPADGAEPFSAQDSLRQRAESLVAGVDEDSRDSLVVRRKP